MEHSKVKFTMENGGEFVVELYPEYAPATVENFLSLVNDGFYDGLTFHRVVEGFMAQGGDPTGTGSGGSKKTIKGEFAANGFTQNTLSHTRGVISMARSAQNDSASSQFFICYSDGCAALDGSYAAFGKVIEGMDVVDSFCDVEMTYNSMGEKASPVEPIRIKTAVTVKKTPWKKRRMNLLFPRAFAAFPAATTEKASRTKESRLSMKRAGRFPSARKSSAV